MTRKTIYPNGYKLKNCNRCGLEFETVENNKYCEFCAIMLNKRKRWKTKLRRCKHGQGKENMD